jgi:hypothetical protein
MQQCWRKHVEKPTAPPSLTGRERRVSLLGSQLRDSEQGGPLWGFQDIRNITGARGSRKIHKHELRLNRHNFKII